MKIKEYLKPGKEGYFLSKFYKGKGRPSKKSYEEGNKIMDKALSSGYFGKREGFNVYLSKLF